MSDSSSSVRAVGGSWLLPPIAALLVALGPTLVLGYPRGHDWLLELVRVAEWGHALEAGQWPPFWAPNLYGGAGSPVFLFYSPLFLAVANFFAAPFGSVTASSTTWGSVAAIWLFAVVGLWALADLVRAVLGDRDDNAAAVPFAVAAGLILWIVNPYVLADALLRNANAEFAALCLLPLPLSGVVRLGRDVRAGAWRLALGMALVVLAHALTALVAAVGVVVLGAVLYLRPPDEVVEAPPRSRRAGAAATLVALGLSSWLWLPALALRDRIRLGELTKGKFDAAERLGGPIFGWGAPHAVGWLPALALAGALGWLVLRRPGGIRGRVAWSSAAAAVLCLGLQTPLAAPLWRHLPFLDLFQFPWRFQGPLALCIAVLVALALADAGTRLRRGGRVVVLLAVFLLAFLNAWPHLSQVRPLEESAVRALPRLLEPDQIARRGLKVTVGDEYAPADPESVAYWRDVVASGRPPAVRRWSLWIGIATFLLASVGWFWSRRRW